ERSNPSVVLRGRATDRLNYRTRSFVKGSLHSRSLRVWRKMRDKSRNVSRPELLRKGRNYGTREQIEIQRQTKAKSGAHRRGLRKARHIEERSRTPGLGHREQGEWRRQKERKWARQEREQGELSQRREKGRAKKETLSGPWANDIIQRELYGALSRRYII